MSFREKQCLVVVLAVKVYKHVARSFRSVRETGKSLMKQRLFLSQKFPGGRSSHPTTRFRCLSEAIEFLSEPAMLNALQQSPSPHLCGQLELARSPRSQAQGVDEDELPAPVSPVMIVRPRSDSTLISSIERHNL